jgi:hypothetical protein
MVINEKNLQRTFTISQQIFLAFPTNSAAGIDRGLNVSEKGMLKKAASGVLAILPCSRTPCTLRASKGLRPCWTDFFEHSLSLMLAVCSGASKGYQHEIFNSPEKQRGNKYSPGSFLFRDAKRKS